MLSFGGWLGYKRGSMKLDVRGEIPYPQVKTVAG
jgi:hypothetical protein